MIFNSSLGIDFRHHHLILTLLKKAFGKVRLVDYRIYPLWHEGQKEVQEAQWISLISTFISKHQFDKEKISVSIPREKAMVRFLRLPAATRENLSKVLEYELPKYVPFDRKEEIHLDFQILREEKDWIYVLAVFVRKADLDPYLALLKRVGVQPISIQIPSTAALNLFWYHQKEPAAATCVLLDLNEPFFEMNILHGGVWKESIHLTAGPREKEEKILNIFKRSGVNGGRLDQANFFLYGLDAAEKTLPSFEQASLKEVSPPPMDRIEIGRGDARPDYIYSSIGLPLKGLVRTRLDLNLLPQSMRKKVRSFAKPLFWSLLCLGVILALTWGAGIYSSYRQELDSLRAEIKKKKPEVEAVERLQKKRAEVTKEMAELEKTTSGEVSMVLILKELTQILPPSVWVWNFKYSGREVEISGFADSASELIALLDNSPLFGKVEFLAPVTKERERRPGGDKDRERFKIKMRLESRR